MTGNAAGGLVSNKYQGRLEDEPDCAKAKAPFPQGRGAFFPPVVSANDVKPPKGGMK